MMTFLTLIFIAFGQMVGDAQVLKEQGETDWTRPFHPCRSKIAKENNTDYLASDNGESLYLLSSTGSLSSIDLNKDFILWEVDLGLKFVSNLEIDDKALFIVTKNDLNNEAVTVRSISKLTGITIWQADFSFAEKVFLKRKESHLAAFSDYYVATFDLATGEVQSRKKVDFKNFIDLDGLAKYISSEFEMVSRPQYFEIIQNYGVLDKTISEISLINRSLILGDSSGSLISYDKSSGERLWTAKAGGKITSITQVGDESVLAGSLDNFLYLYASITGNLKWKRRLPFRITDQPLISDKIAVIGSKGNDQIFFVDLETGKILNHISLPDSEYLTANLLHIQDKLVFPTTNGIFIYSQNPCAN